MHSRQIMQEAISLRNMMTVFVVCEKKKKFGNKCEKTVNGDVVKLKKTTSPFTVFSHSHILKIKGKIYWKIHLYVKRRILSEDFRDFICERENPYFFEQICTTRVCEQDIGFYYRTIYVDKIFGDPITLERFTYGSIPKCYTLIDSETLNQAGNSKCRIILRCSYGQRCDNRNCRYGN